MAALYHSVFTEHGLALLRESIQNGTRLGITHMSFGDGGGALPVPDATFTQMVNEVYRVALNRLAPSKENANWLEADGIIPSAIGGFNIREVGLWAEDVMVAYANYPPTYKPSGDQGTAQIKTIRIVLQIDNTANFELKIDASVVMATLQSVEEAKLEAMNHADSLVKEQIRYVDNINSLNDIENPQDKQIVYVTGMGEFEYSLPLMTWVPKQRSDNTILTAEGRFQRDKNKDYLDLKDYIFLAEGKDWTKAIKQAETDAFDLKMGLKIPSGIFGYSQDITFRCHTFGQGISNTWLQKLKPCSVIVLGGSLRDLTISPDGYLDNDQSDGIIADNSDRKLILNVLTEYHGGNGFVFKKGNLSRFIIRSRYNKGKGVLFTPDAPGDNKAVQLWLECTGNKKSGFFMDHSLINSAYNSGNHYGTIISQGNGTDLANDDKYDVVLSGNYNNLTIYTEYGAGCWHKDTLKGSRIFYTNMSHINWKDEAGDSNEVSYIPSANGTRVIKYGKFQNVIIQNENGQFSGKLTLTHTGNNIFEYILGNSTATQTIIHPDKLTLKKGKGTFQPIFPRDNVVLNFGTIPARSCIEKSLSLLQLGLSSANNTVVVNPVGNIGAGLLWSCYIDSNDLDRVVIRLFNSNSIDVTTADFPWKVSVFL